MPRASSAAGLGVMVLVGCAAPAPPQPPIDPAILVGQLDDPQLRIAAANALVAQGGAAVAPLLAELERAIERQRAPQQREALRLLRALGPQGGTALPRLLALSHRLDLSASHELVCTVAELAPYRPPSLSIRATDIGLPWHRVAPETELELRRLRVRAWSEPGGDLATLRAMASEPDAFRNELAIELLALRGPAARAALPALEAVLERRDPRVTGTTRRVPLRVSAANAILRIDSEGTLGQRARAVLADTGSGASPPSERTRRQIETLVAAYATAEQRELAATHLVALGPDGIRALLGAPTQQHDPRAHDAVPHLVDQPAPILAEVVFELAALASVARPTDRGRLLDALTRAAPHTRDVLMIARDVSSRDPTVEAELGTAYDRLQAALDVPTWLPIAALAHTALTGSLAAVQRASSILAQRGKEACAALPALASALHRDFTGQIRVRVARGAAWIPRVAPEFDYTRDRVAEAILQIADASDPLTAEARRVLDRPVLERPVLERGR